MGLDITALRKIVPASADIIETQIISPAVLAWTREHFPKQAIGVNSGLFGFVEKLEFRAGSYSGYNEWRDRLARFAGYPSAKAVWDGNARSPFVELIDFADNEGVIGSECAAKLAGDFAAYRPKMESKTGDQYDVDLYRLWQRAFELAADDGVVIFH